MRKLSGQNALEDTMRAPSLRSAKRSAREQKQIKFTGYSDKRTFLETKKKLGEKSKPKNEPQNYEKGVLKQLDQTTVNIIALRNTALQLDRGH